MATVECFLGRKTASHRYAPDYHVETQAEYLVWFAIRSKKVQMPSDPDFPGSLLRRGVDMRRALDKDDRWFV